MITNPSGGAAVSHQGWHGGCRLFEAHRLHVEVPDLEDGRVVAPPFSSRQIRGNSVPRNSLYSYNVVHLNC